MNSQTETPKRHFSAPLNHTITKLFIHYCRRVLCMADINGVGRIGTVLSSALSTALKKNTNSHERDAERHSGHGQQEAEHHLSPEQEEAALKKLQELDSFKNAGLSAKIIREAGKAPHIIVLSAEGNVIRQLPYQSIVNIYLEPKTENQSGFLLKKTA